jgi:hypothetical protein
VFNEISDMAILETLHKLKIEYSNFLMTTQTSASLSDDDTPSKTF